jgi:hypothetical protein
MTTSVTVDKNFRVKNGLNVAGTATFNTDIVLGTAPISFDTQTNRLKVQIDGTWQPIALYSEIPNEAEMLSFMDIGLAIDYNGQPTYIVQANGVTPSGTSKFVSGGDPYTNEFGMTFDSGALVA